MSENIIPTIGQHVFRYDPPQYTEKGVPVFAKNPTGEDAAAAMSNGVEPKYQFLGEGYYFWDDNIHRAHNWGKSHYKGKYLILEASLELKGSSFLDLAGSRRDLKILRDVYYKMKETHPNLKIGAFFNGMQTMAKLKPEVWPYKIIRALNLKSNSTKEPYNRLPNSHMLLDPEIIICFYNINELNLQNSRYLDKNDKQWTPKN